MLDKIYNLLIKQIETIKKIENIKIDKDTLTYILFFIIIFIVFYYFLYNFINKSLKCFYPKRIEEGFEKEQKGGADGEATLAEKTSAIAIEAEKV